MRPEDRTLLLRLLTQQRIATLGVVVDDAPYTGLVPFALEAERPAALVHVSSMARHTQGLEAGQPFSLLIHAPDDPQGDPLQVPRVTLLGRAEPLPHDSDAYTAAKAQYLARFPTAAVTFTLGDFRLVRLPFDTVRFVSGFGRAYSLSPQALANWLKEVS